MPCATAWKARMKAARWGYEDTSKVIKTGGDWSFRTTGSWYGEIVLEASEDNAGWEKVKHFTKAQDEDNFSTVGSLELSAKMHYLRLRCLGISGEMGYVPAGRSLQPGRHRQTAKLRQRDPNAGTLR